MAVLALRNIQYDIEGKERYQLLWNQLTDYIEQNIGPLDYTALKLLLASIWNHIFTDEPPLSLWLHRCPEWLVNSLNQPVVRPFSDIGAGQLARLMGEQFRVFPPYLLLRDGELVFDGGIRRVNRCLEVLRAIHRGHLDWSPIRILTDRIKVPAFSWTGRQTFAIAMTCSLAAHSAIRARHQWHIVQNEITTVRFRDYEGDPVRALNIGEKPRPVLLAHVRNLIDFERDRKFRSRMPEGLFNPIAFLLRLTRAGRGDAYDPIRLGHRAIRLAMAHASMMHKPQADKEELGLARRVVIDAIPPRVWRVMEHMPDHGWWTLQELEDATLRNRKYFMPVIKRLLWTGALEHQINDATRVRCYSQSAELRRALNGGMY